MSTTGHFSTWVINLGFVVALALSAVCLALAGYYFVTFQRLAYEGASSVVGRLDPASHRFDSILDRILGTSRISSDRLELTADERALIETALSSPLGTINISGPVHSALSLTLQAHSYIAKIQLLSCGVFAGISIGFLGFCLFLLGVQGAISAQAAGASMSVQASSLAPGAFVMLISALLIGFCVYVAPSASFVLSPIADTTLRDTG